MARNRKRAKERRARRPQPVASRAREEAGRAPNPLEHAAPDAEIAARAELPPDLTEPELEQIELGEPEFDQLRDGAAYEDEPEEEEGQSDEDEEELEPAAAGGFDGGDAGGPPELDDRELEPAGAPVPAPRALPGNRLVGFLQGSWRELQRVQWPDRRQVMQATGVVIGFVIVAGLFLGASDFLAGKLVNLILK